MDVNFGADLTPSECACGGTNIEPELFEVKPGHFVHCNPKILKKFFMSKKYII